MIKLSKVQQSELRELQKQTVEENPALKIILHEIDYINPSNEYPWGQNDDVVQYAEFIENFNFSAYNKYIKLLKDYGFIKQT